MIAFAAPATQPVFPTRIFPLLAFALVGNIVLAPRGTDDRQRLADQHCQYSPSRCACCWRPGIAARGAIVLDNSLTVWTPPALVSSWGVLDLFSASARSSTGSATR